MVDVLWRFGPYEFEEFSRALRCNGAALDLESKPLDVLHQLLLHSGEVVTKEELIEAVWPGVVVVEGSLATAVSKLRKALGDEDPSIVITVPRIGYRLGVPAYSKPLSTAPAQELGFVSGDAVPGRDQWQLSRRLDASGSSEVWLAEHPKTREPRVFKFASDGLRLKGLKREVTIARFLKEALGERPDFVRVLEWNFDAPPYYLESEYGGLNLLEWSQGEGGLGSVPLETRLRVLQEVAQTVAAAHGVGVLHKDLKPANVLIAPNGQVKVADFGSGSLSELGRLSALGITNIGFTQNEVPAGSLVSGTVMYLAPEVLAGQPVTASADVYALGLILYQMAVGDFRQTLSPGWEAWVADPLVREDIAAAASGDPVKRMHTAAELAVRLATLDQRRIERAEREAAHARVVIAERQLALGRARRPWVIAAVALLAVGLGVSLYLYRKAARETSIAAAVSQFLANDLLGRSDPFQSGKSDETLLAAVKRATPNIDRQFQNAPEVAARLHASIARALDHRSGFPEARQEYGRAAELYFAAEGPSSEDGIATRLQLAAMEARTYEKDSLPRARAIVAEQVARIAKIARPRADLTVWLATAQGMIALVDNNAKLAAQQFQAACDRAQTLPAFDETARLNLKQRLGFSYIRLGEGVTAERLFRELIASFARTNGADSNWVLRVRLNLAQAFMIQSKFKEAIAEANGIYPEYVARLGEDHQLTMQVIATRAQSEGSLELWNEAIQDDLAIHKLAVRKQGPLSFYAVAPLSDAALAQCRAGRYVDGEANAREAYEASKKAFGARAGLTGGVAHTLSSCWIGLGKLEEASKLLDEIDPKAVAQLTGLPDWSANLALSRGEIAYRQGDLAAARKYVELAAPVLTRADAEMYQKQAVERLRRQVAGRP